MAGEADSLIILLQAWPRGSMGHAGWMRLRDRESLGPKEELSQVLSKCRCRKVAGGGEYVWGWPPASTVNTQCLVLAMPRDLQFLEWP